MASRARCSTLTPSADWRSPSPDAVEQDHHGRPSFRVAGKIFATLTAIGAALNVDAEA